MSDGRTLPRLHSRLVESRKTRQALHIPEYRCVRTVLWSRRVHKRLLTEIIMMECYLFANSGQEAGEERDRAFETSRHQEDE